jgi:diaminopimelate epimerase
MAIEFQKYEGAGNDFILVDDRERYFPSGNNKLVRHLCDRRFGIGADGLMLLQLHEGYDFRMVYYNADGKEGSMCGNGGRCIAAFARKLGVAGPNMKFMAVDGEHLAHCSEGNLVNLKMSDVESVETGTGYYYLNTGSPHYVVYTTSAETIDVYTEGRKIRYNDRFRDEGTNVDFVEDRGDHLFVRTYERGVENETLACGTGVVASVVCRAYREKVSGSVTVPVTVAGGKLSVSLEKIADRYSNIWLEGPATFVFSGVIQAGPLLKPM